MGLVDAPDPQEAERGLEHYRMVQFLISLSKMVHFKYDQLLEAVELKNLNVFALCTPLLLNHAALCSLTNFAYSRLSIRRNVSFNIVWVLSCVSRLTAYVSINFILLSCHACRLLPKCRQIINFIIGRSVTTGKMFLSGSHFATFKHKEG